jgi:hypothetical protein
MQYVQIYTAYYVETVNMVFLDIQPPMLTQAALILTHLAAALKYNRCWEPESEAVSYSVAIIFRNYLMCLNYYRLICI